MAPFPTTLSEAKELVNSWSPLGLWSNEAPDGSDAREAPSGPSARLKSSNAPLHHDPHVPPSAIRTPSTGAGSRGSADGSIGSSQRNIKIIVGSGDNSEERRNGPEKDGPSRVPRHSSDSRRLSIASGATGRSSDGFTRRRGVLETYIIVKPPAATAKHPLNLQVQLVVRQSRRAGSPSENEQRGTDPAGDREASRAPTPSSPGSDEIGTVPMSRSLSDATTGEDMGSSRSVSTRQRRAGSIKSTRSSDTNASSQLGVSRKRVEPMFNLAVHNVMQPTVVTDAVTDAKVAKFLKRSVEILGVGTLEPTEFWVPQKDALEPSPHDTTLVAAPTSASQHRELLAESVKPWPRSSQSTRSTEDLSMDSPAEIHSKRHSLDISSLRVGRGTQEGTTKKLLGRLFKKKPGATSNQSSPLNVASAGAPSSGNQHARLSRHSSRASHAHSPHPAVSTRPSGFDDSAHPEGARPSANAVGQATFGTSPLIACSTNPAIKITAEGAIGGLATIVSHNDAQKSATRPLDAAHPFPLIPSSRALGYSWAIRKWAKKRTDMWATQIANASLVIKPGEEGVDEIVFEWIKVRLTPDGLPPEISKQLLLAGAKPTIVNNARAAQLRSIPMRQPSLSTDSSTAHDAENGSTVHSHGHDTDSQTSRSISAVEGSESASEHTNDSGAETDPEDSETPWTCSLWIRRTGERRLLATLTPAPHHPKVIGVLKIPMGLKSVNLGFAGFPEGRSDSGDAQPSLSEENLKDVICVTAMWVVAREEFGGLGGRRRA